LTSFPTFILSGFAVGVSYILSGIPFDLIHAAANFLLAFLLLPVLRKLLERLMRTLRFGAEI